METVKPILTCSVRYQREKYKTVAKNNTVSANRPTRNSSKDKPCATESHDSTQSNQLCTVRPQTSVSLKKA